MIRWSFLAFFLLILAPLLGMPGMARAAESYDNCNGFISSVPAVITTQGTWCLKQDLATSMTSGSAITIATNNVTIDCNNFKLDGSAAGLGTQTVGIVANYRSNLTVRRCDVRGFIQGIEFFDDSGAGGGHIVEGNRLDGNTYAGIVIWGDGSVVRRNRVFNTGHTTRTSGAYGITTWKSVDILENSVSGVTASLGGDAFGIYTASNPDGSISDNRVRHVSIVGGSVAYGIFNDSAGLGRVTLRRNYLWGDAVPFSVGLGCDSANGQAKDNVINGFATGLTGCSDGGGNVIVP